MTGRDINEALMMEPDLLWASVYWFESWDPRSGRGGSPWWSGPRGATVRGRCGPGRNCVGACFGQGRGGSRDKVGKLGNAHVLSKCLWMTPRLARGIGSCCEWGYKDNRIYRQPHLRPASDPRQIYRKWRDSCWVRWTPGSAGSCIMLGAPGSLHNEPWALPAVTPVFLPPAHPS